MSQFSNVRRWVTRIFKILHGVRVEGQRRSARSAERSSESGSRVRRINPSGVHRASSVEPLSTSAVVLALGPIADELVRRFPDPSVLTVVDQRTAFLDALGTIHASSTVAITTASAGPPERMLAMASAAWPTARLVWCEPQGRPHLPPSAKRSLRAAKLAGPFRKARDLIALLSLEIERGVGERARQATAGRRYAEFFGLPELGARLVIGVAMGVPGPRLPDLLQHDPERFRQYCSRVVYPRTGVSSIGELQASVYMFERRMDLDDAGE